MKKLLLLIGLVVGIQTARAQSVPVLLLWDYPTNELAKTTFFVYHSTDITKPMTNWTVVGTAYETNKFAFSVVSGVHCYALVSSNFWGTSFFSSVASTPSQPRSDSNLSLQRN